MKVELVPKHQPVLNWASARSESHQLDKKFVHHYRSSKDGFLQSDEPIIHIPTTEGSKVIARFGNMNNLVKLWCWSLRLATTFP